MAAVAMVIVAIERSEGNKKGIAGRGTSKGYQMLFPANFSFCRLAMVVVTAKIYIEMTGGGGLSVGWPGCLMSKGCGLRVGLLVLG